MKREDYLITFLRRYFDADPEARLSVHVTSVDRDHLRTENRGRYTAINEEASWESYTVHFQADKKVFSSGLRLLKFWRSRTGLLVHRDVQAENRISVESSGRAHPPRVAVFALLLIPKKNREHLIGDLEEEYRTILLPQYGRFRARLWYWEQTALALGFYAWPFLKKVLGMAAIWKLIGR